MKEEKECYLEPIYDSRNSFYKKALVKIKEDNISYNELLYSYGTLVAIYTKDKMTELRQYNYLGNFSQTTTRHQKEFFRQKGATLEEVNKLIRKGRKFKKPIEVLEK